MIVRAINGGLIFYVTSTDTKAHIDYMVGTYDLIYSPDGCYIPKQLAIYYTGYRGIKSGDKTINYYDYCYNNMYRNKLHFDNKKARLVDFSAKSENVLTDGLYYTQYSEYGILQAFRRYELREEQLKLLNNPVHAELLNTIEVLKEEIDRIKHDFNGVVESNTILVNEINTMKEAINNIATSIKTIPAVVGSPINPALITNLIVNPADTFENQANIFKDITLEASNNDRSQDIVKLLETSIDIREK
jgi:hypothetical protein